MKRKLIAAICMLTLSSMFSTVTVFADEATEETFQTGDSIVEESLSDMVDTAALEINEEPYQEEDAPIEEPIVEIVDAEEDEILLNATLSPSINYRTHVQTDGWQGFVKDGAMSGTQGRSKRLEGIEIYIDGDENLGVRYATHIQTYGWEPTWKENGAMSGTQGQAKRLEAIRIELTGADAYKYDVWYCVHAQHFGWLNWAKNGENAGTAGYAYRLEGIKIRLLPKGSAAPAKEGTNASAFYSKSDGPSVAAGTSGVAYNTHVQTYGWQDYVFNGEMAGTSGQSKRLEGIHIALVNQEYPGNIEYRTHVQKIGWQDWKKNGQMSGTSGRSLRLEAIQIQLTGDIANYYDVYYKVHAQTHGWLDWAKNGEPAGTSGQSKRLEGIYIKLVKKNVDGTSSAPGSTARAFIGDTTATHVHTWVYVPGKHHDVEYKTVHHDAIYNTVHHDAVYNSYWVCNCGLPNPSPEHLAETGHGCYPVHELVSPANDEQVLVSDAYDEQVLVSDAYDEPGYYKCSVCGKIK